jgi:hypothetical protein
MPVPENDPPTIDFACVKIHNAIKYARVTAGLKMQNSIKHQFAKLPVVTGQTEQTAPVGR